LIYFVLLPVSRLLVSLTHTLRYTQQLHSLCYIIMASDLEPWAIALIVLAGIVVGGYLMLQLLRVWAKGVYNRLQKESKTACDIDAFVDVQRNPVHALKVVLVYKFQLGNRTASTDPIPLECSPSPHVDGLQVSRRSGTTNTESDKDKVVVPLEQILAETEKPPIVIATIRMGFGHHRLAYSAASWALQAGHVAIFHDLLNIESPESDLVKSTDELYSRFSRYASEIGGVAEKAWGAAMKSGDADALRIAALTAAHLQPLLLTYPKDTPIITTHQLVALTASAAGFTNVVNLVVDNHAQWFLTVPNTKNIVQGPVNYQNFLRMGIDAKELAWEGHWCPYDMVQNIEADCQRRIARAQAGKPVRLLIPVGGAGAQRKFIVSLVEALAPLVRGGNGGNNNAVQLFLNAGDHAHMKQAFLETLDACNLDFDTVTTTQGVRDFQAKLLSEKDNKKAANMKPITLFSFDEYFPAVATTDILCRVSDVLCCKPSELAFYAVPKLHIRRVGDHEADSALRAAELGDGTVEARTVDDAMDFVTLFRNGPELLTTMNESIIRNNSVGIYDGCKKAVELVLEKIQSK
jgi:hypothetical protein